MSFSPTVLITGANRGIGKGLIAAYLAVPNSIVIAAVRDIANADSLHNLPKASGTQLIVTKIDLSITDTIRESISTLKLQHNISNLDVVIANAGKIGPSPPLQEATRSDLQSFIDVNAYGQLELFQATAPLLRKSTSTPKFVYISSAAGSLTSMRNILPVAGYGSSKAFGNYLMKWLSLEIKDILIWSTHPGIVETESNKEIFKELEKQDIDFTPFIISTEQSVTAIKALIDGASLEETHGKFLGPDGKKFHGDLVTKYPHEESIAPTRSG